MGRSIILLVPWVNDECNVIYDRFDYKGHICNSIWDPDSYYSCSSHATFGAESINGLLALTKAHLGYLNPNNFIPLFFIRAIYINIRSMVRQEKGRQGINDIEFLTSYEKNGVVIVTNARKSIESLWHGILSINRVVTICAIRIFI